MYKLVYVACYLFLNNAKHIVDANYVFKKSCEKQLITKECTVTHAHSNFMFKWASCFGTLAIKLVKIVKKFFKTMIVNAILQTSVLRHPYDASTFKTPSY